MDLECPAKIANEVFTCPIVPGRCCGEKTFNKKEILFHVLVKHRGKKTVNSLRESMRGAEFNVQDEDGNSPLHLAVLGVQSKEVIKILIKRGSKVEATNHEGSTPLHLAAKSGYH